MQIYNFGSEIKEEFARLNNIRVKTEIGQKLMGLTCKNTKFSL